MHTHAVSRFLEALQPEQRPALFSFAAQAEQVRPADLLPWHCGTQHLGWLAPQRAAWLAAHLPACSLQPTSLQWHAEHASSAQRSAHLQEALLQARAQGLLGGWRDERFSFWHTGFVTPEPSREPLFAVERSGFRFLGVQSHAVHVNGFGADGSLWCGQRALSKATDPGMLDNLTAGGLPSGETVSTCLLRELAEEAGLHSLEGHSLQAAGWLRTTRVEPQGWHDEIVHVYNITLASDFAPHNQDGEVAAFHCLRAPQVLEKIQQGAFTVDATQTLLQGLRHALALLPGATGH